MCDFELFSANDIEEFHGSFLVNGSDIDVSPIWTLDVCDFESIDEDLFCDFESIDEDLFCAIQNSLRDGDFLYDWM
jgi:hypothetical protein